MSALAMYFHRKGIKVEGYDRQATALTLKMEQEGITIIYEDRADGISNEIDLVVITPAIPRDSNLLRYFAERKLKILKRSELLGKITEDFKVIAVAGTHGKTSTSALISHVLKYSGRDITAFVGGIMTGYDTNFFMGTDEWMVVEADEFDRSFLKLSPTFTVLNSLDADHLDIYNSVDTMRDAYGEFLRKTKEGGAIFIKEDLLSKLSDKVVSGINTGYELIRFGFGDIAEANIQIYSTGEEFWSFRIKMGDGRILDNLRSVMPGYHNVLNAAVAVLVADKLGVAPGNIRKAMDTFKGIKRRFEKRYNDGSTVVIDDYAHHPEEIRNFYEGLKITYPTKRLLIIFQPHLYSRTRDFAGDFAKALDMFDEVILTDIYPARELPIEGVSSDTIMESMKNGSVSIKSEEEILSELAHRDLNDTVVSTVGAGDIGLLPDKIISILQGKNAVV